MVTAHAEPLQPAHPYTICRYRGGCYSYDVIDFETDPEETWTQEVDRMGFFPYESYLLGKEEQLQDYTKDSTSGFIVELYRTQRADNHAAYLVAVSLANHIEKIFCDTFMDAMKVLAELAPIVAVGGFIAWQRDKEEGEGGEEDEHNPRR